MAPRGPDDGRRRCLLAGAASLLAGCAGVPREPSAPPSTEFTASDTQAGWHEVKLPGKVATNYRWGLKAGRPALAAQASASASMWRRRLQVAPAQVGEASFSWWVDELIAGASVAHAEREDAPARVLFGFGGDTSRLNLRARMMFELAQALTGEEPPFATLMYVWETEAPVGSMVINPRTDRVRKIVLDSGVAQLGRWRDHRRDLVRDYRLAFGEDPGPLQSVALMTDADNTRSSAAAWYGPVRLHPRLG